MSPRNATSQSASSVAVLYSGGLDSAALVAMLAAKGRPVWPMYVRCGLRWEDVELRYAQQFLKHFDQPGVQPLRILELPVADVYAGHWSLAGDVPPAGSPDEDVYLPARIPLLLIKPAMLCANLDITELALGTLSSNPFPDAASDFLSDFSAVIGRACGCQFKMTQPLGELSKAEVIFQAGDAPVHLSMSCLQPQEMLHCGRCNKCDERRKAYRAAGVEDLTRYVE